jgi:hypothetical protein
VKPPSHIDGALVLEWAWSDRPFGHVSFDDGSVAATIHGLAICQYPDSRVVYRFSCNANWETEQDMDYSSSAAAKASLPEQYQQSPVTWKKA